MPDTPPPSTGRISAEQSGLGTSASHIRTFILDIGSFSGTVNLTATKSLFLQTHELTLELAVAMRELFITFVNTDQLENAELAASVLALLWLRLGNFHEGLRNLIDHLQLRFTHAESPEAYTQVRSQALATLSKAVELEDHEFAFRAAVLAADASYFGHAAGGQALGLNVPLVLAAFVAAAHRAHQATNSPWFARFPSLFAGILQTAVSEPLSREDQENADRSLRHLAGEVDLLLQPHATFWMIQRKLHK